MPQKRLNYVDMSKGIAIIVIVLYHLTAPGIVSTAITHIMPSMLIAFFFFSGYFYRPGKRTLQENIAARAKSLLIPFVSYSLLFWLVGTIYHVAAGGVPFMETLYCLRNYFAGCIWNRSIQDLFQWEYYSLGKRYLFLADFWFLIAMFLSSVLFFPIADATLESKPKTLLTAAALFAATGLMRAFEVSLPYNLHMVPFWTALLLLGAFAGKYGLFAIQSLSGAAEWLAAVGVLGAGVTLSMLIEPSTNLFRGSFAENEVPSMVLLILSSLLVIWGVGEVFKLVELANIRVTELTWLGSHTLTMYLFHMFIAWLISITTGYQLSYSKEESNPGLVVRSLLVACVVMAVCIIIDIVKDKIAQQAQQEKPA